MMNNLKPINNWDNLTENNIVCMKWGDKYDDSYVEKLKEQCEANCSVPFNFWCFTEKPEKDYHIKLWNPGPICHLYDHDRGYFWAYRKCYMFRSHQLEGDDSYFPTNSKILFLDLDVIIHQDLKYFFDLPNDKPWIVRGWWNDPIIVRKNYARYKSTVINSSIILWTKGQMIPVWEHVRENAEILFFTYPSLDNYFAHQWYNTYEEEGLMEPFPKGDIYSWYKGNIFPDDMELKKLRTDHKICLFNNSTHVEGVYDDEIKKLW